MKQVEEEYYKAEEKLAHTPNSNNNTSSQQSTTQELYPPSPDQPLHSMNNIPEPVREAINLIIKSQKTVEDDVIVIPQETPQSK